MTPDAGIHVVRDGALWLVVAIPAEGHGAVLGRWTDRARAEQEACYWLDLAQEQEVAAAQKAGALCLTRHPYDGVADWPCADCRATAGSES